jgi:hypothetical protein
MGVSSSSLCLSRWNLVKIFIGSLVCDGAGSNPFARVCACKTTAAFLQRAGDFGGFGAGGRADQRKTFKPRLPQVRIIAD